MMDAFTEDEKRFVLAEYIKASQVGTEQLIEFIKMHNLQADWFSMQLPGGRNLHQCMRATSNILDIELQVPSMPNLKRKSMSNLSEHAPKRVASMTPVPYQPRPHPHPHPQQPQPQPQPQALPQLQHQPSGVLRAVNIQPRPSDANQPTAEGYGSFQSKSPSNGFGVFQSNPTVRKRGRPSKAEKEAQARANSSSYTLNSPIPISPKPIQPALGTPAYTTTLGPADSRTPRAGNAGAAEVPQSRGLPHGYAEAAAQSARVVKSEKSPSIGNLVTSDPSAEQHKGPGTSFAGAAIPEYSVTSA